MGLFFIKDNFQNFKGVAMFLFSMIFAVFTCHFLAAFLHYHTMIRDHISREKLESFLIITGLFIVVLKYRL